jgi:hypothetical protein
MQIEMCAKFNFVLWFESWLVVSGFAVKNCRSGLQPTTPKDENIYQGHCLLEERGCKEVTLHRFLKRKRAQIIVCALKIRNEILIKQV